MRAGYRFLSWIGVSGCLAVGIGQPAAAQGKPAAAAAAAAPAVTAVTARVNIGSYRGPCPAKLVFTGTITTATIPKAPITYQWIRSDDVAGPKRTLTMTGTTATVTDPWQLGRAGEQMRVWKRLKILTPNAITSSQADAVVLCG